MTLRNWTERRSFMQIISFSRRFSLLSQQIHSISRHTHTTRRVLCLINWRQISWVNVWEVANVFLILTVGVFGVSAIFPTRICEVKDERKKAAIFSFTAFSLPSQAEQVNECGWMSGMWMMDKWIEKWNIIFLFLCLHSHLDIIFNFPCAVINGNKHKQFRILLAHPNCRRWLTYFTRTIALRLSR